MYFRWDGTRVVLEEAGNFRSFKLVLPACARQDPQIEEGLRRIGTFESDEVFWVARDALLGWPPCAGIAGWRGDVEAMIAKAAPQGWVDAATGAIRAHVEREEALS